LNGKSLLEKGTIQGAMAALDKEMVVPTADNGLTGSVAYRRALAKSLLYKV
jgi:hypothetical protein